MKVKNIEIIKVLSNTPKEQRYAAVVELIQSKNIEELSEKREKYLKEKLRKFVSKFNFQWNKFHWKWNRYESFHEKFLQEDFNFELNKKNLARKIPKSRKLFEDKKRTQQRIEILKISSLARNNCELLLKAAELSAKENKKDELASSIKSLLKRKLPKSLCSPKLQALNFHLDNNFTKSQYNATRKLCMESNFDILPSYHKLLDEKKKCLPEGISVNETIANVPLKSLHQHTMERIKMFKAEDWKIIMDKAGIMATDAVVDYECPI